jgi:hypothetical protein
VRDILILSVHLVLGLTALFVSPHRIAKLGERVKPATLLQIPPNLCRSEYRLLFSSSPHRCKPGPKGPSAELIAAIVEMERRNPRFGYMRTRPVALSCLRRRDIPPRIDPPAQQLGNAAHGRFQPSHRRLRCRIRRHRWRLRLPDVQSRQSRARVSPSAPVPITTHFFDCIAGSPICGSLRSKRSNRFRAFQSRIRS